MVINDPGGEWQIDRKVNLLAVAGFIIAVFGQFGAGIWFAAKISSDVSSISTRVAAIEQREKEREAIRSSALDRLSRLETEYFSSKADQSRRLDKIENKLDSILERLPVSN